MRGFVLFLALLGWAALLFPIETVFQAIRVEKGPKIDGRLDDEVWQKAELFTRFLQNEPMPGASPVKKPNCGFSMTGAASLSE